MSTVGDYKYYTHRVFTFQTWLLICSNGKLEFLKTLQNIPLLINKHDQWSSSPLWSMRLSTKYNYDSVLTYYKQVNISYILKDKNENDFESFSNIFLLENIKDGRGLWREGAPDLVIEIKN